MIKEVTKQDLHGTKKKYMRGGHTQKQTYRETTYMEKRHIRRKDKHGEGIYIEWE